MGNMLGENMHPIRAKRKRITTNYGIKVQISIKMGKELSLARRFPFKRIPQKNWVAREKH